MTDLDGVLADHAAWAAGRGGKRANLTEADMSGVNLTRANLTGADMTEANLTGADMSGVNLTRAN